MSRVMHKVALIQSMHHGNRLHDSASTEALTGRPSLNGDREEFAPISQFYPCFGACVSYLWQNRHIEIPHAALPFVFHNVVDTPCQGGGFLGPRFDPLQISLDVESKGYRAGALTLPAGQTSSLLSDRRRLLRLAGSFNRAAIRGCRPTMADVLRQGVPVARFGIAASSLGFDE